MWKYVSLALLLGASVAAGIFWCMDLGYFERLSTWLFERYQVAGLVVEGAFSLRETSGFSIFAPEKSISQHDLLVPLSTTLDNSSWASPNIRVSVSGKEFSTYTSSISTENIGNWPSIAVSNQIAERNLQSLNKELASLSSAGSSKRALC